MLLLALLLLLLLLLLLCHQKVPGVMVLARVMSPLRDSHSLLARVECYSGAPVMVLACVMVLAYVMVLA